MQTIYRKGKTVVKLTKRERAMLKEVCGLCGNLASHPTMGMDAAQAAGGLAAIVEAIDASRGQRAAGVVHGDAGGAERAGQRRCG